MERNVLFKHEHFCFKSYRGKGTLNLNKFIFGRHKYIYLIEHRWIFESTRIYRVFLKQVHSFKGVIEDLKVNNFH